MRQQMQGDWFDRPMEPSQKMVGSMADLTGGQQPYRPGDPKAEWTPGPLPEGDRPMGSGPPYGLSRSELQRQYMETNGREGNMGGIIADHPRGGSAPWEMAPIQQGQPVSGSMPVGGRMPLEATGAQPGQRIDTGPIVRPDFGAPVSGAMPVGGGQMISMMAPDGKPRMIPAAKKDYYTQKWAAMGGQ